MAIKKKTAKKKALKRVTKTTRLKTSIFGLASKNPAYKKAKKKAVVAAKKASAAYKKAVKQAKAKRK